MVRSLRDNVIHEEWHVILHGMPERRSYQTSWVSRYQTQAGFRIQLVVLLRPIRLTYPAGAAFDPLKDNTDIPVELFGTTSGTPHRSNLLQNIRIASS
jgi:hypothetical protein